MQNILKITRQFKLNLTQQYMSALEKASVGNDITDFANFIGEQVSNSVEKKTGSM